jgi:3-deoxy-D-manno-octulosonate 8-phosphate phosphatase (KDO 8-P phosphatase)
MNNNNGSCPPKGGAGHGYPTDCELTGALLEKARRRARPTARSESWQKALPKAAGIKLLLLDVDGVLTDGTITYTHDGGESKSFHTQDGFGLRLLQDGGVEVGLITARTSEAVRRRAADLRIPYVYQGIYNKQEAYEEILQASGLRPPQTAYMGDDWLDLPILNLAGFSAAPADAVQEVRQRVDYVTAKGGGYGAVREVCELILEARGELANLLRKYS